MKIKALLIASALLVAGVANAKENEQYVTNSFTSNWYVGIGAGANGYIGSFHGPFGIGPAVQISFGKMFTPEFGARFDIAGITTDSNPKASYWIAGGDLLWDWPTTFAGYNPERVVSVMPYLHADLKGKLRGAGVGAGMMFPIRLNEHWTITPEFRATFYNEATFGTGVGRCLTGHALVSVYYGIGAQGWQTKEDVVAPLALAVAEAEAAKAAAQAASEKAEAKAAEEVAAKEAAQKENAALKEELDGAAAANEAIVKNLMNTPACVFFEIGQATLSVKELEHFDRIVKTMVSQGKNMKFTVSGYSDKNTGSVRRNKQLAKQRANYIVKLLTGKYGLDAANFVVETSDCKSNKFTTIELNRAVIIEAAE